ncbi:MAG: TIGR02452 family protein [Prevotellaceae bacterium]|jgi:uncharacterized protein (TIGR02452 family)|nr:TIGR02452 family protein [Prevotellaceae bacterium]
MLIVDGGESAFFRFFLYVKKIYLCKINNKIIPMSTNDFDSAAWLEKFRAAQNAQEDLHGLRAEIFQNTVSLVKAGGYRLENDFIKIDNDGVTKNTEFFTVPAPLSGTVRFRSTSFSAIEADCLETAGLLISAGFNPCVLNMASRQNPGGGVVGGAGAQEENIFRRTNLFMSLYQFVDYSTKYGIARSENSYPLERKSGGIYSPEITVFRGSEQNGYYLLQKPFNVSFVTVPAINRPALDMIDGKYRISSALVEPTKEKMRVILRIAGKYMHDSLVLGAFGCGAFCNPPEHVAELFLEVFYEDEFASRFKFVSFPVLDDHNTYKSHNPEGNALPFHKVFNNVAINHIQREKNQ